jgi:hypothetical protein
MRPKPNDLRGQLNALLDEHGQDKLGEMFGIWLADRVRQAQIGFPKPPGPARAPSYLQFVRGLKCACCGQVPSVPHHYGPRGMGQKTDDYRTVPLCVGCHESVHAGRLDRHLENEVIDTLVAYLRALEGT